MSGKREKIVAAALKLFCEQGFHQTSTTRITKEAGVATGTLFLYFSSKDVLINSLYKEAKGQLTKSLAQNLPVEGGVREKVRHIWFAAGTWAFENKKAFRFIHMFKSSPYISRVTREEAASSAAFAEQLIQEGMKGGVLLPVETGLLFSLLDGLLTATVEYIISTGNEARKEQILERAFEILWKGITSR